MRCNITFYQQGHYKKLQEGTFLFTISFININEKFLNKKRTSKLNLLICKNYLYLMTNLVLFQEDKIGLTLVESVNENILY